MTHKQTGLLIAMFAVLGLMFMRVAALKANVEPLREVIKAREQKEDMIRFRATAPMILAIHKRIKALRSDYPELNGYGDDNLFLVSNHDPSWRGQRKIFFNSLLRNNDRPAPQGIKLHIMFCSRRGPQYYCGFGQNFGQHYLWQENQIPNLGIGLSCSIDSSNPELLQQISRICDETAGGTMEIVQQRNIRQRGSEGP